MLAGSWLMVSSALFRSRMGSSLMRVTRSEVVGSVDAHRSRRHPELRHEDECDDDDDGELIGYSGHEELES